MFEIYIELRNRSHDCVYLSITVKILHRLALYYNCYTNVIYGLWECCKIETLDALILTVSTRDGGMNFFKYKV